MKKFLLAIASLFVVMGSANASNVDKIEFANKGQFTLGAEVGVPPRTDNANMPFIGVDAMWGLADGFIHTKTFGNNGAIDLGLQVGYTHWGDHVDAYNGIVGLKYRWRTWELPINVRAGFHFEFVKHLDVYAGLQGGVAIYHWRNKFIVDNDAAQTIQKHLDESGIYDGKKDSGTDTDGIFGMYVGAKWYFTDVFGVKAEYSGDWICNEPNGHANNLPYFAVGVTFNF